MKVGKYFRDFAGNIPKNQIDELKEDNKPSIVLIHNSDEFVKRITQKLMTLGIKESEVIFEVIEYDDKMAPFYCTKVSPSELKIKDEYL